MSNPSATTPENPGEPVQPVHYGEDYERFLEQCAERHLWSMLLGIQGRLGTPAEEPDDLVKVQAIAHRLSNILTAIRLKTELALLHQNPQPQPSAMQWPR